MYLLFLLSMSSENKTAFYERFNEKSDEFCKDLIQCFPGIDQFKYVRSGLSLLKNIDMKQPQRIFHTYISTTNYRDFILEKNEDFFLNTTDIHIMSERKEYWTEFIQQIRDIWKTLSQDDKDTVWKYFHILLVLSDKCQS